ncbi:MAG TPA: DinB family protein [Chloroflexia bacterium]|nr:DinB family protein [Chloroflexia bacterium]
MDSTTNRPLKPRLLTLVARGQAAQQAFVAQLTAAERDAWGQADHWSAKDHIAHLTAWRGQAVLLLAAAGRGEPPAASPEEAAYNAQVFAEQRDRPWSDLLADAARVDAAFIAGIESCTEVDLAQPERFPLRGGRALAILVLSHGYQHPIEHFAQFYQDRGDLARAAAVQQAAVATIAEIFGESEAWSFAIYNLGCFYAKTGQARLALDAVGQALAVNPGLREWAGQDSDLVSLHDDPAFQALVGAEGDSLR